MYFYFFIINNIKIQKNLVIFNGIYKIKQVIPLIKLFGLKSIIFINKHGRWQLPTSDAGPKLLVY